MTLSGAILLAVYHPDVNLLRRQVESLRGQTLRNWQCHVGIDGADAQTCALLDELVGEDDRFFITEYAENVGHYRNFERLTQEAPHQAAWVAYCDQDDYWYPDKLRRLVGRLYEQPSISAVVGAARLVDDHGIPLGVARRDPGSVGQLLLKNAVTGSFAVFRPDVLGLALPFPTATQAAVHDHWLGVCAATLGEVVCCDEPLQDYVQHDANAIGEVPSSKYGSLLKGLSRGGGPSAQLTRVSRELWGWRVSMAATLLARANLAGQAEASVRSVARGRLTLSLSRHLMREARAGHLSWSDGFGMGAAAFWWPRAK